MLTHQPIKRLIFDFLRESGWKFVERPGAVGGWSHRFLSGAPVGAGMAVVLTMQHAKMEAPRFEQSL